jgi:GH15 family glucan-1,4-alpha-glucosidase
MPRDLPIGNGNILIAFDQNYLLREFYFPLVGEENHVKGEPFRFGVWIDDHLKWIPDHWEIKKEYLDDSLVTCVKMTSAEEKLRIECHD